MNDIPINDGTNPSITGVVLACNGERLLEKCLASLNFCQQILVVDSGSTDTTLKIAVQFGAVIREHPWQGFDVQFTYAQTQVETDWFFILDQDEICPEPLGEALRVAVTSASECLASATGSYSASATAVADNSGAANRKVGAARGDARSVCVPVGFSVGRKSWYFDRFLKHSGWYPDHILRLFRTGFVEFYQDAHIQYKALGPTVHVGGPGAELVHYPYTSFSHQLTKLNLYAEQGAEYLRSNGKSGGVTLGLLHGLGRFVRLYLLKCGFLDGRAGFLVALHGAFYAFLKYVRVLPSSWGAPFDRHK